MKKNPKTRVVAIVAAAVAAGAVLGWHYYRESQKSALEKGGEKTSQFINKAADKTKSLFK